MVGAGIGTVLTAAYLLGVVRRVAQGPTPPRPANGNSRIRDVNAWEVLAWAPLVALVVVLGLVPGVLLGLTDPAVSGLLAVMR